MYSNYWDWVYSRWFKILIYFFGGRGICFSSLEMLLYQCIPYNFVFNCNKNLIELEKKKFFKDMQKDSISKSPKLKPSIFV